MHDAAEAVTVTDDGRCRVSWEGGERAVVMPFPSPTVDQGRLMRIPSVWCLVSLAMLPHPPRTHARPRRSHCYILQSVESTWGKTTRQTRRYDRRRRRLVAVVDWPSGGNQISGRPPCSLGIRLGTRSEGRYGQSSVSLFGGACVSTCPLRRGYITTEGEQTGESGLA